MNRLTERDPYWLGEELWTSAKEPDDEEIDAVYNKLKYYEDMEERLIKAYGNCENLLETAIDIMVDHSAIPELDDTIKAMLLTNGTVDKYKEWKAAEAEGRLVIFPRV